MKKKVQKVEAGSWNKKLRGGTEEDDKAERTFPPPEKKSNTIKKKHNRRNMRRTSVEKVERQSRSGIKIGVKGGDTSRGQEFKGEEESGEGRRGNGGMGYNGLRNWTIGEGEREGKNGIAGGE